VLGYGDKLPTGLEAAIHRRIVHVETARNQGRIMGAIREAWAEQYAAPCSGLRPIEAEGRSFKVVEMSLATFLSPRSEVLDPEFVVVYVYCAQDEVAALIEEAARCDWTLIPPEQRDEYPELRHSNWLTIDGFWDFMDERNRLEEQEISRRERERQDAERREGEAREREMEKSVDPDFDVKCNIGELPYMYVRHEQDTDILYRVDLDNVNGMYEFSQELREYGFVPGGGTEIMKRRIVDVGTEKDMLAVAQARKHAEDTAIENLGDYVDEWILVHEDHAPVRGYRVPIENDYDLDRLCTIVFCMPGWVRTGPQDVERAGVPVEECASVTDLMKCVRTANAERERGKPRVVEYVLEKYRIGAEEHINLYSVNLYHGESRVEFESRLAYFDNFLTITHGEAESLGFPIYHFNSTGEFFNHVTG
ncbi:TPA: hypothetical protein ACP7Q5_004950, partial [Escherichia coli]